MSETIRIVRGGEPTPEQTAALVAVLLSRGSAAPAGEARSAWADPRARLRGGHVTGGAGWTGWGRR